MDTLITNQIGRTLYLMRTSHVSIGNLSGESSRLQRVPLSNQIHALDAFDDAIRQRQQIGALRCHTFREYEVTRR
jgi:hypothetical protein